MAGMTSVHHVLPDCDLPENPADIRTLTIAFLDIAGSTGRAAQTDLEEYDAFLEQTHALIDTNISAYGGRVLERWGDGALAVFGMVQDAEDAATAAILCALAICDEAPVKCDANIRAGLHSGAVVCRTGETPALPKRVTGLDVTIAARLQEHAVPGTVAVSAETRSFTQRIATLHETRGAPFIPKGLAEPMTPWLISGVKHKSDLVPNVKALLGRQTLLNALLRTGPEGWARLITGPAGGGKSALLHAVAQQQTGRQVVYLSGRANLRRTSLFPCTAFLRQFLHLHSGTSPAAMQRLMTVRSLALSDQDMLILWHILHPADTNRVTRLFSPQELRARKITVLTDIFLQVQQHTQTTMIFDDIDLADPDSYEVFRSLIRLGAPEGTRLYMTARTHNIADSLRLDAGHVVALGGLNPKATELLITRARPDLDAAVIRRISEMSEGNPLFAESLALSQPENGGNETLSLPTSLTATMEARLRSFDGAAQLIRAAAVLGRRFQRVHLLALISKDQSQGQIRVLTDHGLLHDHGDELEFGHLLLRNTAYKMIPKAIRKQLHGRAARVLHLTDPPYSEEFPEVIADHAIASQDPALIIPHCLRAGIGQLKNAHFDLALQYLNAARDAVADPKIEPGLRDMAIPVTTLLASAEVQSCGFAHPKVKSRYAQLLELVRESRGNTGQKMHAFYGLFAQRMISGDVRACGALLSEMDHTADTNRPVQQLLRWVNHAAFALYRRDLPSCADAVNRVEDLYDPDRDARIFLEIGADPYISALTARSYLHATSGRLTEALLVMKRAEHHAGRIGADLQIPWIRIFTAQSLLLNGDPDTARDLLKSGTALAEMQGGLFWSLTGKLWSQIALLEISPARENIAALGKLVAQLDAIGAKLSLPYAHSRLARAYRRLQQMPQAEKWAGCAVHGMTRTGERLWAPYILEEFSNYSKGASRSYQARAAALQSALSSAQCDAPHRTDSGSRVS